MSTKLNTLADRELALTRQLERRFRELRARAGVRVLPGPKRAEATAARAAARKAYERLIDSIAKLLPKVAS
ncbi:MAG TPA: hypothetical protein VGI10_04370 [Polyangiaceae bacterium]